MAKRMKEILLLTSIALTATASAWILRVGLADPAEVSIRGDSLQHFGDLLQEEKVTATFDIYNGSSDQISIVQAVRTCSCSKITFSNLIVKPGDTERAFVLVQPDLEELPR
jgi:hypothetical protein